MGLKIASLRGVHHESLCDRSQQKATRRRGNREAQSMFVPHCARAPIVSTIRSTASNYFHLHTDLYPRTAQWANQLDIKQRGRSPKLLLPSSPDNLGSSATPVVGAAVMSSRQTQGNIWRTDAADSHTVKGKVRESVSGAFRAHSCSRPVLS